MVFVWLLSSDYHVHPWHRTTDWLMDGKGKLSATHARCLLGFRIETNDGTIITFNGSERTDFETCLNVEMGNDTQFLDLPKFPGDESFDKWYFL